MSLRDVWTRALPFLGVRSNAEHTRYAFRFAEQLVRVSGGRGEVVLPAIILHDTGWSTVPEDKILDSFGPKARYPELRRQHEVEGARIAREILTELGTTPAIVTAVTAIIDGHDTRAAALSTEDAVVKDADKLWLFTRFGMTTVQGWFGYSAPDYLAFLDDVRARRLHTEPGKQLALGLLVALRAEHELTAPG